MAQNLNCKSQKANSKDFNDNFDRIFRSNQDIPFPEEIREREIERRLKEAENELSKMQ